MWLWCLVDFTDTEGPIATFGGLQQANGCIILVDLFNCAYPAIPTITWRLQYCAQNGKSHVHLISHVPVVEYEAHNPSANTTPSNIRHVDSTYHVNMNLGLSSPSSAICSSVSPSTLWSSFPANRLLLRLLKYIDMHVKIVHDISAMASVVACPLT